jgi:hypothetical protein
LATPNYGFEKRQKEQAKKKKKEEKLRAKAERKLGDVQTNDGLEPSPDSAAPQAVQSALNGSP